MRQARRIRHRGIYGTADETYDGGFGRDTLLLQQGATLIAGVVVTGIEAIVYG